MLKILIAVDGSELSLDAVRHALRLHQEGLAAGFVLANVQEPASLYEMLTVRDPQRLLGLTASAGEHSLQAARQLCDDSGIDYEFEVASGEPAHTLVDIAERYGCIGILAGARGKGGLGGGDLGSVAQELMHVSPLPVTIVKHPEAEEKSRDQEGATAQEGSATESPATQDDPIPVLGLA
jgi:nucleotide-binding universal stress UspA family protein